MENELEFDEQCCRSRQNRLLELMREKELDDAIVATNQHVHWLSGVRFADVFQTLAHLSSDGRLTLIAPHKEPAHSAADHVEVYSAKWLSTMRNDQMAEASLSLLRVLEGKLGKKIGIEKSSFPMHLSESIEAQFTDIEPDLFRLRRKKERDELAKIKHAIGATGAMYRRAREIIRPGVFEIDIFNDLQATAVSYFDEMLTGTGNDYQCGSRGGPPRGQRAAKAGELYILDLGPAFRGYFADNSRAIAVSEPSEIQLQSWREICPVFEMIEEQVKPGVRCKSIFEKAQSLLDRASVGVFNHHLGHGIGLFPHEAPHLNPNWDDEFEVGDVFTVEPGLYAEELKFGMRLENDYVVVENGVELLSDFPLELKI